MDTVDCVSVTCFAVISGLDVFVLFLMTSCDQQYGCCEVTIQSVHEGGAPVLVKFKDFDWMLLMRRYLWYQASADDSILSFLIGSKQPGVHLLFTVYCE